MRDSITKVSALLNGVCGRKGQGLTEFVLVLAFCAAIGWSANSVGFREAMNAVFDSALQTEDKTAAIHGQGFDINRAVDKIIKDVITNNNAYNQSTAGTSRGKVNISRGFLRSQWVNHNSTDGTLKDISGMEVGLGATSWLYVIGTNGNVKPAGLYWTTENITDDMFGNKSDQDHKDYTSEKLICYYYDRNTQKYKLIKNSLWTAQADLKGLGETVTVALRARHDCYGGDGVYMGNENGYDTYAEAQQAYKELVANNAGVNGYKFLFE